MIRVDNPYAESANNKYRVPASSLVKFWPILLWEKTFASCIDEG
jgi:hypothetical protein